MYKKLFKFWKSQLKDILIRRVIYNGLPPDIPLYIIEKYLLEYGTCGFTMNGGKYVVVRGAPSGVTPYDTEFTNYVWSAPDTQPLIRESNILNVGIVMLRNNESMQSMNEFIDYYADLLAQTDLSYRFALINTRMPSVFHTTDSKSAGDVKSMFESVEKGDFATLTNTQVFKNVEQCNYYIPPHGTLTEFLVSRNNILRSFYLAIGLVTSKDKSQAVLSDESYADYQAPSARLDDLIRQREEDIQRVNEVFGLNITVKLAPPYRHTLDILTASFAGETENESEGEGGE